MDVQVAAAVQQGRNEEVESAKVEALLEKHSSLLRRLENIPAEIAAAQSQIKSARSSLDTLGDRVDAKRKERQQVLADAGDARKLTQDLEKIRAEQELAEDTILGLEEKVGGLQAEELRIQTEDLPPVRKAIALYKVAPLVSTYNRLASEIAEVTQAIILAHEAWNQPLSQFTSPIVTISSWQGFAAVPRLSFPGEPQGDFFNIAMVLERHRKATLAQIAATAK